MRRFGAGVSIQPFGIGNILEALEGVPVSKLNIVINANKSFRAELDFGYFSRNDKTQDSKNSAFVIGLGLLGTKRIEANVIMGGIKF